MQDMTPNQPYLLRAFYDWILDNGLTPYMAIDANFPEVQVPTQFVNEGQIVLNVSPNACVNFNMDLEYVQFQARFSGQPMLVSFPVQAVSAVYAKENGAGTMFTVPEIEHANESMSKETFLNDSKQADSKSHSEGLSAVTASPNTESDDKPELTTKEDKKPKGKPGLRIVK